MPLSMFLIMHGCSTTEMARAGMGNQGASGWWSSPIRPCSVFMVAAKDVTVVVTDDRFY
jgi:hypothetical protein